MEYDIKVSDETFDKLMEVVEILAAPIDSTISGKCRYHYHA